MTKYLLTILLVATFITPNTTQACSLPFPNSPDKAEQQRAFSEWNDSLSHSYIPYIRISNNSQRDNEKLGLKPFFTSSGIGSDCVIHTSIILNKLYILPLLVLLIAYLIRLRFKISRKRK